MRPLKLLFFHVLIFTLTGGAAHSEHISVCFVRQLKLFLLKKLSAWLKTERDLCKSTVMRTGIPIQSEANVFCYAKVQLAPSWMGPICLNSRTIWVCSHFLWVRESHQSFGNWAPPQNEEKNTGGNKWADFLCLICKCSRRKALLIRKEKEHSVDLYFTVLVYILCTYCSNYNN